jgi:hypothetical protein
MSQKGFPVSLQGIMFEKSGIQGTLSGMPPAMAVKSRSLDVMVSFIHAAPIQTIDLFIDNEAL